MKKLVTKGTVSKHKIHEEMKQALFQRLVMLKFSIFHQAASIAAA
jgi:hypothetical protein